MNILQQAAVSALEPEPDRAVLAFATKYSSCVNKRVYENGSIFFNFLRQI